MMLRTGLQNISPRSTPAPKMRARVRTTPASALRGLRSAKPASGANQAGYWGRTFMTAEAGGAAVDSCPSPAVLASAAADFADGGVGAVAADRFAAPRLCGLGR